MKSLFLVMIGGAVGAALRHLLALRLSALGTASGWPWGTFAANIAGGLAMGLLAAWVMAAGRSAIMPGMAHDLRLLLGVGLIGGFTTFSAFSLEMAMMVERGAAALALAYALASVAAALAALFAGLAAGRALLA